MPCKEGHLLVRWVKEKKQTLSNYALDGVAIYTQSLQRHRRPSYLSCRRGRKPLSEFTKKPIMTLKQSLMAVIGETEDGSTTFVVTPQY